MSNEQISPKYSFYDYSQGFGSNFHIMETDNPFKEYQKNLENCPSLEGNEDEDQKEEQSKNSTSFRILKPPKNNSLEEDEEGDKDIINFKNKLESINFNRLLDNEKILLVEDINKQIKIIHKKKNDSNSIYTKSYFDKEIEYLCNKVKELEKISKPFKTSNTSSKIEVDLSSDKLDINKINNIEGNKGRKKVLGSKGQQENLFEATCFTSKNNELKNDDIKEKAKDLELTIQNEYKNEYKNYYEDLFIKILRCSLKNITMLINKRANEKYQINLDYIYIPSKNEIDKYNYKEFLESTIKDIYLGKFLIISHEEKYKIKHYIDSLLKFEEINVKEEVKLLNILFDKNLKEILLLYLSDTPHRLILKKYDKKIRAELNLKSFKTFKNDFSEYKNEKKQIIEYIYSLLKITKSPNGNYNIRREIIKEGLKNFHFFIKKICNKYVKRNLHSITVKKQILHSTREIIEFLQKSIYDFYKNSLPRNLNKECKNDHSKYTYNIDLIHEAIEKEKKQEKKENRILGKIFNKKVIVKDIIYIFIEKKENLKIEGEKDITLEGFITYTKCFNDKMEEEMQKNPNKEKPKYTFEKLADYKYDFINVLNGEAETREKSEIRNKKLKNNSNLGRKKKKNK